MDDGKSLSLIESGGCGVLGRALSTTSRQVQARNSDTTAANSDENWQCSACGERVTPDLITPADSIVVVVRCPVCGMRDEIPQGVVWG